MFLISELESSISGNTKKYKILLIFRLKSFISENIRIFFAGGSFFSVFGFGMVSALVSSYIYYLVLIKLNWKKVQSKQKHALGIIFKISKTLRSEPLFVNVNVLVVYKINIFKSAQFMQKMKNKNSPHIFPKQFSVPCHAYPTNISLINFPLPQTLFKFHGLLYQ